jgi:DNA repair exonuclease SbcCD ATPase subunit
MSDEVHAVAKSRPEDFQFYCPNGHAQHYTKGETETDKLRRERDRLKQEQAWYEQQLDAARSESDFRRRQLSATKGQITKMKKRAANGICPCCNRSFTNLQRHMASQHPGFISEPTADEHVH